MEKDFLGRGARPPEKVDAVLRKRCGFFDRRARASVGGQGPREALELYYRALTGREGRAPFIDGPFLERAQAVAVLGALLSGVVDAYGPDTVESSKNNLRHAESFLSSFSASAVFFSGSEWRIEGRRVIRSGDGLGVTPATFQAGLLVASDEWLCCAWFESED